MARASLAELPAPPPGKTGWPWTRESGAVPARQSDGRAWPRISIVTPSFNQGSYIEETIRSILLQGYPDLEYVIMDGGSTDQTIEIIKKYEPWLTNWFSEKDRGQAHAINKAIALFSGEIAHWINSDDSLAESALINVARAYRRNTAVAGAVYFYGPGIEPTIRANTCLTATGLISDYPASCYEQPGVWLPRAAFCGNAKFDERYHYGFDWYFMTRYLLKNPDVSYIPDVLVSFRLHHQSKTVSQASMFLAEQQQALHELLDDPDYAALHSSCRRRLEQFEWTSELNSLLENDELGRAKRAYFLIRGVVERPGSRANRMALGAMRRILTAPKSDLSSH
jgi:Glycosyl transferase family 2